MELLLLYVLWRFIKAILTGWGKESKH